MGELALDGYARDRDHQNNEKLYGLHDFILSSQECQRCVGENNLVRYQRSRELRGPPWFVSGPHKPIRINPPPNRKDFRKILEKSPESPWHRVLIWREYAVSDGNLPDWAKGNPNVNRRFRQ
jgi:hypothetical protein